MRALLLPEGVEAAPQGNMQSRAAAPASHTAPPKSITPNPARITASAADIAGRFVAAELTGTIKVWLPAELSTVT
jgi:hypothetical protein